MRAVSILMAMPLLIMSSCSPSEKKSELEEKRAQRTMSVDDVPDFRSEEAKEYYIKGNDARDAGDLEAAREFYERSHLLENTHVLNLNNLAGTCMKLNDLDAADKYYKKALALDPGYEITYVNYSNFFIAVARYEEGLKFGQQNLEKINDETMQAYFRTNMALMYAHTQQCVEAKRELEKAKKVLEGNRALESIEQEIQKNCL